MIWPDVDSQPVLRANQFLAQLGPGPDGNPEECILTIGYAAPPVLLGSPEEQRATVMALGAIESKALARVSMSRARVGQLIDILQQQAQIMDGTQEQ